MDFCMIFTIVVCSALYALIGAFCYDTSKDYGKDASKQAANPEAYIAFSKIRSILCGVFWPVFSTYNACIHVFALKKKKGM